MTIGIARVYEGRGLDDGRRVLVDRLWPRGLRRDDPRLDSWEPSVAPSTELRRWYDHRSERFDEFCARYEDELAALANSPEVRGLVDGGPLTLLTATKELGASHLGVLARFLSATPSASGHMP